MNPFTPDYQFAITKTHNHAITETLSFMLNFFFIQIIFYLTSRKTFSLMKINSTSWATGVGSSSNCVKNVKQHNACIFFDNLHPNINMHILQTVSIHFLRCWQGEFCLTIKDFSVAVITARVTSMSATVTVSPLCSYSVPCLTL